MSLGDKQLRVIAALYTAGVDLDAVRATLRAERLHRRWSLDDLAEKSGVNRSAIHDIETNRKGKPRLETIAKMVEGMGLTLSEFFARIEGLKAPSPASTNRAVVLSTEHGGGNTVHTPTDDRTVLFGGFSAIVEAIDRAADRIIGAREQAATPRDRAPARDARRRGHRG